jgi:hypothetical protein
MINVFSDELTPRIQYSFRLVFETILNNKVQFFQNEEDFKNCKGVKINYSDKNEIDGLYLKPSGLLNQHHLEVQYPDIFIWDEEPAFFPVESSFLPFDIFSASFYLVSRYEEYLPGKRDSHQRFNARNSCAVHNNFLEKPLVNIWALKMAQLIKNTYPEIDFIPSQFQYIPTIDIDNAWAFKNKGFVRISLSIIKDLVKGRFKLLKIRLAVVNRIEDDPYDSYSFMKQIFQEYNFRPIFFFLLNSKGKHDRSLSYKNSAYRNLIVRMSKVGEIGAHPSYASSANRSEKQLGIEISRLKSITEKEVKYSRQHYLKFTMPTTYRRLLSNGIEADYSMGYPSRPGFRASIATPFYFFDVLKNETTRLTVYPFQVMDVTLLHYRNMRAADASKKIEKLILETARVGGTFISLWHNESLNDNGHWNGWQTVYTQMTQFAADLRDGKNTTPS